MIIGDILNEALVDKVVSGAEVVFNFAGIADIDEAKGRSIDTVRYTLWGGLISQSTQRLDEESDILYLQKRARSR